MKNKRSFRTLAITMGLILFSAGITACKSQAPAYSTTNQARISSNVYRTTISDIDSFDPAIACEQTLEVLGNNKWNQEFFRKAFRKLVSNLSESKDPQNHNIIWEKLVVPLKSDRGRYEKDIVVREWNEYFSKDFEAFNIPKSAVCSNIHSMKKDLVNEMGKKDIGFTVAKLPHLNVYKEHAMFTYDSFCEACPNCN